MAIEGANKHFSIKRNRFRINGTYNARGILSFLSNNLAKTSTGTIVGNTFYHESGASADEFIQLVNATFQDEGITIDGNDFIRQSGSYIGNVISIETGTFGTVIMNNRVNGMGLVTNAGTQTTSADNDNYVGAVEQ